MYEVKTIGGLGGGLAGQDWPGIPPGWVPHGTPGLPGVPAPVPGPPVSLTRDSDSIDAPVLVLVAVGSLAAGVLGMWLYERRRR